MRIIAGQFKGRRLDAPRWDGLRPTSDKLRETLFNIVAPRVDGARVLDVFAGTGALGLESLSRGAIHVVFVERDRRAAALISSNVERCGASNRCAIIRDTAEHVLQNEIAGGPFDLVMLDPPYDYEPLGPIVALAGAQLAPDGLLILEHASRRAAPEAEGLRATRTVRSGDSSLTMFEAG